MLKKPRKAQMPTDEEHIPILVTAFYIRELSQLMGLHQEIGCAIARKSLPLQKM